MSTTWWIESLWRTAIVAATALVLLLVSGALLEAWRRRRAIWTLIKDHAWYRFPFAQRRLIERWELTRPWTRWGMDDWVRYRLSVIDRRSRGNENMYRLLRDYLNDKQAKEEA